ncbi:endonuclease NucS [Thermococcus sp.]|uniref:endonuclease NucS n=1 Tax=Thermococcus sp. TaxID=35749 RepID=UPI00262164A9|nr:endonuclease NucS [Thermococcus sp.]
MNKVEYLSEPAPEEAREIFERAISRGAVLVVFARCKVHYEGRAKSELGSGDRVIVVKPDGSFLVHQSKKREPVNWQPPGSVVRFEMRELPALVSVRRKPRETLVVEMEEIYHVVLFRAEDYEELALTGSEAEMAEMIFRKPELIEHGFRPLHREKPIRHGIVDILGVDKDGNVVVLELKRRRAELHAVRQLKSYVETLKEEYGDRVRGILVAPSLTSGARKLLEKEGLEFRKLEPPKRERSRGRQRTLF